ncbi:hypothetical protein A8924_5135 [Saccharopolyspora erythraea NRRL 2338]|nr:hypothetical protein N599_11090 [Saccharopolyspora erythraea D]PFG97690.1 hypothetical protein A8924_5135 [Saccharopolyspora erythraea NRRL 2338]
MSQKRGSEEFVAAPQGTSEDNLPPYSTAW